MEDSADVGLTISCLSLDTTHFAEPTLLVGTYRDSTGYSILMTVDPATLAPIDTIYRSTFVPNACRAADLNGDFDRDFLIGLTSMYSDPTPYSAVVALYGPDYLTEDTLLLPRPVRDLVVDEVHHEFWLGYFHDTTFVTPQPFYTWYSSRPVGLVGAFTFDLVQSRFPGDSLAGHAFAVTDANADGTPDVVALWLMGRSIWCSGCIDAPQYNWVATGVWSMDGATEATSFRKWVELGSRVYTEDDNDIIPYRQLPVLDLTGDGWAEAVLSWTWYANRIGRATESRAYAEAYSLADGQRLWQRQLPLPSGASSQYTAIPYELDPQGTPDLLLIGMDAAPPVHYVLIGLRGENGDSLFATEFRYVSSLNVTLASPVWDRARIIDASGAWLVRWRLDDATSLGEVVPDRFVLCPTFPNPFNAETRIEYSLKVPAEISLTVHDALGRHVTNLVDAPQAAGDYSLSWDGRNSDGQKMPSGVYFLRLRSDDEFLVRKMALTK